MRIPFPERVNLTHVLIFATALCGVQIFEGTNPFFSGCAFCFIMVAAIGFNIAGGIMYPSGAFIFFNALFTMVLPLVTKAVLREPADSNLRVPMRTVEVYLLGMVAMVAAAIFSRRFRARKSWIADMLPLASLRAAYVGCAVLSVLIGLYLAFSPGGGNGTINSFLLQADRFPLLTFVLGVVYTIRRTEGRRSVTGPLLLMILFIAFGAILSFSKEQFLSPFFAWAVTAALMRYRLKWINVFAFTGGLYFVVVFMVPYTQYGRGFVDLPVSRIQLSTYLLTHMDEVREGYAETRATLGKYHYYNEHLSLLDRLDVVSGDDALIDVTDREGTFGYAPMIFAFENLVPHVLWRDKPVELYGNTYAHEIGILPDEDSGTGVSFSPSADAYHEGRMVGVLALEPAVLMLIFIVLDSVIGDVRLNPVGLLTTILVSRGSSEGLLSGNMILIGQALFTNVLAVYVCAYALPVIGAVFSKRVSGFSGLSDTPASASPSSVLPSVTPL